MSHRIFNFSAGPAMLPTEVLEKSANALVDFEGKGFGIAEVSHRGKEFDAVADEAILRAKKLAGVGDTHDVVFLQGGATALFTIIPMNFLHSSADYLVSGEWSKKAASSIVDMGAPLGKALKVTPSGASPTTNDLGGYSVLQAESKEALAATLKGHPHFMMGDSSIEIVELMPMPGT